MSPRRSQNTSGSGFVVFIGLGLAAWLILFIIRHIWVILGGLVFIGSIYAARAILRENARRRDAYARYCAGLAARADQQDDWVAAGDDRGVFGPKAVALMSYIRSGGKATLPTLDAPAPDSVPAPLTLSRQAAAPAMVASGVGMALLLAQIGGPDLDRTSTPPAPPRTTAPTWTPTPTTRVAVPTPSSSPTPTPIITAPITTPAPITTTALPPTATYLPPETTAAPPPATQAPVAAGAYFRNCREAHAAGRYNIPVGDPAYRPGLDRDHDGFACE